MNPAVKIANEIRSARRVNENIFKEGHGVYFIQASSGPIKIGCTKKPILKRLEELQTGSFEELSVIGVIAGSYDRERELHQKFSHLHIRGEWFRPERDLLEFVESQPPFSLREPAHDHLWTPDEKKRAQYVCMVCNCLGGRSLLTGCIHARPAQ